MKGFHGRYWLSCLLRILWECMQDELAQQMFKAVCCRFGQRKVSICTYSDAAGRGNAQNSL
jgi:hypothetical protein